MGMHRSGFHSSPLPCLKKNLANAAGSLATVGTDPAIMISPSVLRRNLTDNAKAAAIQAAADAAAAATENPRILRAVLVAAAATANALAQAIPLDPVPPHRRGGRPPPRRANPSEWQSQTTQNPEARTDANRHRP